MSVASRFAAVVFTVFACVSLMVLTLTVSPARAQVNFTVNDTSDAPDADTSDGVCETTTDGVCTLRAAIQQANATENSSENSAEPDEIRFAIPGEGTHTISPGSALPTISEAVVIDGYTQTGATTATEDAEATLKIELAGTGSGNTASGFTVGADGGGTTIRGLVINRFSSYGVHLLSDGNTVEGNYIGTNVAGDESRSNDSAGVLIDGGIENPSGSSDNVIGGTDVADRNVISGNGTYGVWIFGTSNEPDSASGNTIAGNYIGTDATGTERLANGDPGEGFAGFGSGVHMMLASGNTVGGAAEGARNVISGNGQYGVHITSASSNNEVLGNYIGTDVAGMDSITNEESGVRISNNSKNNTVGEPDAGNLISGNNSFTSFVGPLNSGVEIGRGSNSAGTTGNKVQGNLIGTDRTGTEPLGNSERNDESGTGPRYSGNGQFGVRIVNAPGNLIGGEAEGAGNVISGNLGFTQQNGTTGTGVSLALAGATGNEIKGNRIGVDATGTKDMGNLNGVEVRDAPGNLIGGTDEGARNVISGNAFDGVSVIGETAGGNEIKGNYIGTDATGTKGIGNATGVGGSAVDVVAPRTVIGGTEEGAGNLISGNGVVLLDGRLSGFGIAVGRFRDVDPEAFAGSVIQGNLIGTDATGTKDIANLDCAIIISDVPDTLVGGTEEGAGNVISGNGKTAIQIDSPNATGNRVLGNFIGTDVTGKVGIGNEGDGILIFGAPDNIVGEPGAGNVLSASKLRSGIDIAGEGATGNTVQANLVGTDVTGTQDLGNAGNGIEIFEAPGNLIGGSGEGEGNVTSGNRIDGIQINGEGARGNEVYGNLSGTDITGEVALPNEEAGIFILDAPENVIGGSGEGEGNVFSGNKVGALLSGSGATGNDLVGNFIGTEPDGTADLGNTRSGVRIVLDSGSNVIGGNDENSENVIAYNEAGIATVQNESGGNAILRNSIFDNDGLGIDLDDDGVTQNDPKDRDSGPNGLQNFPEIGKASTFDGKTTVRGTLSSTPNKTFTLRFFSSPEADDSGFGEGRKFLGEKNVTTNSSGAATFDFDFTGAVRAGDFVTATATSSSDDTSEFSKAVEAAVGQPETDDPETENPNRCTIVGTPGNDDLRGTPGRDIICGLGGDDVIRGLGGNDIIYGGPGDDLILGGAGNDRIFGGEGDDVLRGGPGSDALIGGKGRDLLEGEGGNDRINVRDGVRGNDVADGGAGRDTCVADARDVKKSCP